MCDLHLSILKYIGVHGFVDLLNHKCDLGRFPLDSGLGPPGKILLFLPPYPLKISASGISSDPGTTHLPKIFETCTSSMLDSRGKGGGGGVGVRQLVF